MEWWGVPPLNTDDFRDSGFWTLPYPEGHKRRSQLEVGTQRACRRLAFNNYFWDAEMHRRWRVVASSSGANFLPRNFDEIFEPLSFAIPKSPTTTQARPSSGQSKFSSSQLGEIIFMEHILHFEKKPREARVGKFVWVVSLSKLRGQNWDLRGGSVEQINKGQSKITELTWQNTQLTINSTVPMSIEFVVYSLFLAEALELAFEAWSHCVLTTRQLNIIHKWTCV